MPIAINGSGTVTGISAGGLPDATITQAELASGVAGNGPAFSAYRNTNQTISSGTYTKIQFNTESFDTNNNYDSATNYRFTPTVAGYYFVTLGFLTSGTTYAYAAIYKNGTEECGESGFSASGLPFVAALVYLNGSSDYVEGYAYISNTTVLGGARTKFTGFLARAA